MNINNEPLLDKEIVRRAKLLKMQLGSNVTVSMFTNGTLLSIDKLEALADSIDELIINNYSMQYRLNERNREIFNFVKKYPDKFQNMNIVINRRYTYEILATRAGNAPNKRKKNNNIVSPCIYPYTDLTIFPDGTVGLCCNDCYEVTNYGNIKENSLKEIWGNDKFKRARELMAGGRQYLSFCQECDVVDTGFRERLIKET